MKAKCVDSVIGRAEVLRMMPIPTHSEEHIFDPLFQKCGDKIISYDSHFLVLFRALFSSYYSVLAEWATWYHLMALSCICFLTTFIVAVTDSWASVEDNYVVVNKATLLLSFVFAGYLSLIINRWDRIRNGTFGMLWGSLENLHIIGATIISRQYSYADTALSDLVKNIDDGKEKQQVLQEQQILQSTVERACGLSQQDKLSLKLTQLCRACLMLTFYAVQDSECQGHLQSPCSLKNLEPWHEAPVEDGAESAVSPGATQVSCSDTATEGGLGILSAEEISWLRTTKVMTRPQLILSWIMNFFDQLASEGYEITAAQEILILKNVTNARDSATNTIGAIEAQLPYPYVHLIYWTTQLILTVLAIETGVVLATNIYQSDNGADGYSPADDADANEWPKNKEMWYANQFFATTASNMIFALFTEGALKICDKLSNPLSIEDTSFSEKVFGAFLFNNCRGIRTGYASYEQVKAANAAVTESKAGRK